MLIREDFNVTLAFLDKGCSSLFSEIKLQDWAGKTVN